jgi:hypothetical protein
MAVNSLELSRDNNEAAVSCVTGRVGRESDKFSNISEAEAKSKQAPKLYIHLKSLIMRPATFVFMASFKKSCISNALQRIEGDMK